MLLKKTSLSLGKRSYYEEYNYFRKFNTNSSV